MTEAVEGGRGRWSTAIGLTFAVLALSVLDALALVVLPLAILMVALPSARRTWWVMGGVLLWVAAFLLSGGGLAVLSRGWALTLGAFFLVATLLRPAWSVTSRALAATGCGISVGGVALLVSDQVAALDNLVRTQLTAISSVAVRDMSALMPESPLLSDLPAATERLAQLQTDLFPALIALQSLAALALASWWVRRLGRSDSESFRLAPLRQFRFNDQLIWMLILAIVILLVPSLEGVHRIGLNGLVFMAALYILRGLAVFVFLAAGSKSVATMILGALAFIILYPVALTATLLMGVGDTWLDVRGRVATASPT